MRNSRLTYTDRKNSIFLHLFRKKFSKNQKTHTATLSLYAPIPLSPIFDWSFSATTHTLSEFFCVLIIAHMGGFVKGTWPCSGRNIREGRADMESAPTGLRECCAVLVRTGLPDGPFMRDLPCPGRRSQARPYRFARNTQKIPAASAAGMIQIVRRPGIRILLTEKIFIGFHDWLPLHICEILHFGSRIFSLLQSQCGYCR